MADTDPLLQSIRSHGSAATAQPTASPAASLLQRAITPAPTAPPPAAASEDADALAKRIRAHAPSSDMGTARSGRLGAPLAPQVPAPVADFMTKVGNTLEFPMTLLGAAQMDWIAGRSLIPGQPRPKNDAEKLNQLMAVYGGDPNVHPNPDTSTAHALRLISQGQLGQAADLYSTTSIIANKQRAALGDVGAKYFQHHPAQFGGLAFLQEFANPANIAVGKATGLIGEGIAGTRVPTINRFKAVRDAAQRAAGQRALAPQVEAERLAQEKAGRYDVPGKTAEERAKFHYQTQVQQSEQIKAAQQAAADRAARTPKLAAAPQQPQQLMLPGQGPTKALPPAQKVTASGEARLGLPPPATAQAVSPEDLAAHPGPEPKPVVKPMPTETYQDYIARRGGASMTAEEREAANVDWHKTWPEGSKPPIVDRPTLIARIRDLRSAARQPSASKARIVEPQPKLAAAEGPELQQLAPGKEPGTTVPRNLAIPYKAAPIVPSGPPPLQGPFRYDLSPTETADRAEIALRKLAIDTDVRRSAQDIVADLGQGLTRKQQQLMVDMVEGTVPIPDHLQARVDRYRAVQQRISDDLVKYQVAEPGQVRLAKHYFPRLGSTSDPTDIALESEAIAAVPHEYFTKAVRQGTLAKTRLYDTYEQARHSGAYMDPTWEPMRTLETSLLSRLESIKINKVLTELRAIGLMTYEHEPVPEGWVKVKDLPTLKNFGSEILRTSAFPPEIAKALTDITVRETSLKPEELLPTPLTWPARFGSYSNWLVSRWQTASPQYHGPVNLFPSQLATIVASAPNPVAAVKGLATYAKELFAVKGVKGFGSLGTDWETNLLRKVVRGEGFHEAMEAGATSPFSSDIPAFRMLRPWADLSPEERWQRIKDWGGRTTENLISRLLYQAQEPRMASATFKALKAGGHSDARAALLTRQTIGEPENIPGQFRGSAQWFMFPSWRLAMGRLWPWLLGKAPGLYMGPQRAARAYNISRGAYNAEKGEAPPITQAAKFWPYLFLNRDAQGTPQYWSFPAPANIPLQAANLIPVGDQQQTRFRDRALTLLSTLVNPWGSLFVKGVETARGNAGFTGMGPGGYILTDLDAPGTTPKKIGEALQSWATGYAPVKPSQSGLLDLFGVSARAAPGDLQRSHERAIEHNMRMRIHDLRSRAQKLTKLGYHEAAAAINKAADDEYNRMVNVLTTLGMMPQP